MSNTIDPNTTPVNASHGAGTKKADSVHTKVISNQHKATSSSSISEVPASLNLDSQVKNKLSSLKLPIPSDGGTDPTPGDDSNKLFNLNTLLDMILSTYSGISLEMGVLQGSLANQQVEFTEESANATYNADMQNATATIVGGALGILAGVGMIALSAVSGGVEVASNIAESATDEVVDSADLAEGGVEDEVGGADSAGMGEGDIEMQDMSEATDEISQNTSSIESKAEDNAAKVEDLSKSTGGADDVPGDTSTEGTTKKSGKGKGKKGALLTMALTLTRVLPQAWNGAVNGASEVMQGAMKRTASAMQKVAGYDQATAQLVRATFDETSSTVNSSDKFIESILQAHNQQNQFLSQIAQAWRI